jgi:hypothetical protein
VGLIGRILARIARTAIDGVYGRRPPPGLRRLGTAYGGWWVSCDHLAPGDLAVCVGAGEDISFDVALNASLALRVLTLDPTPRAVAHVQKFLATYQSAPVTIDAGPDVYVTAGFDAARFVFCDVALWSKSERLKLFAPRNAEDVSHSALNLQETDTFIEVQACTLEEILRTERLENPRLLKIDIEGAEYAVIKQISTCGPYPEQLLVEFDELHHPKSLLFLKRILDAKAQLRAAGYFIVHAERGNVLFTRTAKV